jgi:hypothetical protein
VINAQTHVATKGAGAIIPPGKLAAFLVMQPEGVSKSPSFYFVERKTLSLAAHYSLLPKLRVVNVAILRRNIEVSAKDHRRVRLVIIVEKPAQAFHPVKLKLKLFRADRLSIRYVNINNANSIKGRREEARVRSFLIFVIAPLNINAFLPRDDADAVITLLPEDTRAVTDSGEVLERKLVVGYLGFLHAKDVGLDGLKPTDYVWQASDDGVNVPGCDFHNDFGAGNVNVSPAAAQALKSKSELTTESHTSRNFVRSKLARNYSWFEPGSGLYSRS